MFYGEKRKDIGSILRQLCEWKQIHIIEAEVCPDHVHTLLEIPPKVSVSSFVGFLKEKKDLLLYERFPELKLKYRNRKFWCRGDKSRVLLTMVGRPLRTARVYMKNPPAKLVGFCD